MDNRCIYHLFIYLLVLLHYRTPCQYTCLYADINATYGAVALYPEQHELSAIGAIPGSQVIGTYPVKGYKLVNLFQIQIIEERSDIWKKP